MAVGTAGNDIVFQVPPTVLWKAFATDSQNLMPKILPHVIKSIVVLEGDGGVGTVKQCNFTDAVKDFTYWKEQVDELDEENSTLKYSVIEGGLIGKKMKSMAFKFGFEDGANGVSLCKFTAEFEAVGDGAPEDIERVKEMVGNMSGMFKAVEGYLLANPDAYA
ncbi:hypothetical protein ACLOJK_016822 [Asimina triloba]